MKKSGWKITWENLDLVLLLLIGLYLSTQFTITGNFLSQMGLILLVAAAEKYYVGKANVIQNVGVVALLVIEAWSKLPEVLQWYLVLGVILGVVGLILYLKRDSLKLPQPIGTWFNGIIYALYSMKSLLGLYVVITLFGMNFDLRFWVLAIVISLDAWLLAVRRLGHNTPWEWTAK